MRRQRGLVKLVGLAALVGLVAAAAKPATADLTTEQGASILVFPKVIANGTRDTIIQITNTSNSMRHAHCFYVNAAPTIAGQPVGPNNPPLWIETDFDIWLTKQQPTHWVVSTGRNVYPVDTCRSVSCDNSTTGTANAACCDAGLAPGRVPPVAQDFVGELKCIEVDASGAPIGGNALTGQATIEDPTTGDVSKYNAVGFIGFDTNNGDNTLCLGGDVSSQCPTGAEYSACPDTWYLDHAVYGAPDPVASEFGCSGGCTSSVTTNLTFAPCSEDFEHQSPGPIVLQFAVYNEYEERFSASTTVQCWDSYDLNEISDAFSEGTLGGLVAQTYVRSVDPDPTDDTYLGVIPVIEETHTIDYGSGPVFTTTSAQNAHASFADQTEGDIIVIPGGQGADQP